MKRNAARPKPRTELSKAAARALKRAAVSARVTAKRYGTRIHVIKDGKIRALDP